MVKNPIFEKYIKTTHNSEFKKVPKRTWKSDNYKIYEVVLSSLLYRIVITSDCWKFLNGSHCFCATAHYIDDDWYLQKKIIGFIKFEFPHTATNLRHSLITSFPHSEFKEIFFHFFNNVSKNTTAIEHLKNYTTPILDGKLFHVYCFCHIINLYMQDGLKVFNESIVTLRNTISCIRSSSLRK